MPRPKTPRQITAKPGIREFRPVGNIPDTHLILSLEEYEAIRLIDYQGLDQSQAADIMNVSRQTVGRVLKSGRHTLSRAIVDGLGLKVKGGCYKVRGRGRHRGRHQCGRGNGCGRNRGQ